MVAGDRLDRIDGRRRRLLAGLAGVSTGATAGCLQQFRSMANRNSPRDVSLEVKTVPADIDPRGIHIARDVADNLEAVGIGATVTPMDEQELLRDVLINNDFDLYVARHPGYDDPDFLRPLLHSDFVEEPGWQNPFGFTDLEVDDLLDAQRRSSGDRRRRQLSELQRAVARQQPFSVVAFPDDIWAVRTDRFVGWNRFGLRRALGILGLDAETDDPDRLDLVTTDDRLTKNLNPLASEFRNRGTFVGLLYDSLGRRYDGEVRPWLAADWEWSSEGGRPAARVDLREDLTWHDGEPLTADDVAFTYELLADTSLGREEDPIPAPRFRGRVSLVETVRAVGSRTVEFAFADCDPEVAVRAFAVPVLPEAEWESKASEANFAGIGLGGQTTEAVVWDNPNPVGSGPLQFEEREPADSVVFSRFDDHFLHGDEVASRFGATFETLQLQVVPSNDAAIEVLTEARADAAASTIMPKFVPEVAESDDVEVVSKASRSFYHLGFNVERAPLGNPRFRQNVARLLDKGTIVSEVFDDYAVPAATPLAVTDWAAPDLEWDGEDPVVPFFGSGGDLDTDEAHAAFRDAGYRYAKDGSLRNR
ncbi:ABC transporter substrate-binding protein [Halorussus amylolyticus]|uniref:ABC transporter substrate-binding protein n=1 Tax=Halorussus amylolyticus TaxID=1126242 RepID=UPI00104CE416|nr:ABC transporter substrate-binding protein [Halorussus amylolyticus]